MTYDLRPTQGDLAEARAVLEPALDACERAHSREEAVSVGLAWRTGPVVDSLGGAVATPVDPTTIEVGFDSRVDGWADAAAAGAVRAWAAAALQADLPDRRVSFRWQDVLVAAAAARAAADQYPDVAFPWDDVDRGDLAAYYAEVRETLGEPAGAAWPAAEDSPAFPVEALGAVLAAEDALGDALADCTRSDVRDALDDALGDAAGGFD